MSAQPLRILIFALGGEGGGVLMNWIVAAAQAAGLRVQATSVPGVAQRTGSTSYYIEIAPAGTKAVLGLVPMPGRVDVVVASELVEAARAMEAGFVSPRLTTLIASTNRVYATAEKIEMGDGRYEAERIVAAAGQMAKRAVLGDYDRAARENATFISATLFGALAGSGALPWDLAASEAVMGTGRAAEASRRGFRAAAALEETPAPEAPQHWPASLREVVAHGQARVTGYQDADYGTLYLDRVTRLQAAAGTGHVAEAALAEAARRLALWMAYEDIARVAELKTAPERFTRIADEVRLEPGQVLKVTEFLKPRGEELADMLPPSWGPTLVALTSPLMGRGLRLRSNGILGHFLLRRAAGLKRLRPRSARFAREQAAIDDWLALMETALPRTPGFAEALAALPRLRKGYSDTLARGLAAYDRILADVARPAVAKGPADADTVRLRGAIAAALADDSHGKLDAFLAGQPAQPPVPQLKKA